MAYKQNNKHIYTYVYIYRFIHMYLYGYIHFHFLDIFTIIILSVLRCNVNVHVSVGISKTIGKLKWSTKQLTLSCDNKFKLEGYIHLYTAIIKMPLHTKGLVFSTTVSLISASLRWDTHSFGSGVTGISTTSSSVSFPSAPSPSSSSSSFGGCRLCS